jgi:arginine/lysine/ornithine decarboxylase
MRICAGKDQNMATAKKTGKKRPGPKPGARKQTEKTAERIKERLRTADQHYHYDEMEAAVDLFLPAHLKRYLNASTLTTAQAYFIGAASAHFVASMSGLQKEFLMSALSAQIGTPGIVPPECMPNIEDLAE